MSELVAAPIRTEQPVPGLRIQGILNPKADLAAAALQQGEPAGKRFPEAEATDLASSGTDSALSSDPHKHAPDSELLSCSSAPETPYPSVSSVQLTHQEWL
jgi:hypothetical protein